MEMYAQCKHSRRTAEGQPKDSLRTAEGQPRDTRRDLRGSNNGGEKDTLESFLSFLLVFYKEARRLIAYDKNSTAIQEARKNPR